jgi:septal ring factor EnvC (AmiA/AmiB activator)
MSGETERDISGWTVDTLKEHIESRLQSMEQAIQVATREMDRRLGELNQLRKEVTDDRSELVQKQAYEPAQKELYKQLGDHSGKLLTLASDVAGNANDLAAMKNSLTWLTRLIAGALILGIIALIFQRIGR